MIPLFFIIAAGCCFIGTTICCNVLLSPNHPDNYPNNLDKTYKIQTKVGSIIEITFVTFDLEDHTFCIWDWLKIVDKGQGSTLLDKVCGGKLPAKVISKSNNVDVIFHSDSSETRKGFSLNWKALDIPLATAEPAEYSCSTPAYNPKSVRGAHRNGITLWDNGLVPYEFTSNFQDSDIKTFDLAVKEIQEGTCIKFVPRTAEAAYIRVDRGCGCKLKTGTCWGGAWVRGGLGKREPSNLEIFTTNCLSPDKRTDVSLVIHEILHSLGVVHTQTRPDRNSYIWVLDGNIEPDSLSQYAICPSCLTYNTPYNCMSVMHYNERAFQKQGAGPTMKKKYSWFECDLGNYPTKLADSDITLLNRMYKCDITLVTQGYEYKYFAMSDSPSSSERFSFTAKAKANVYIALDSDENDSDLYEIVIGGWENKLSMVRRGTQGRCISDGTVDMKDNPGPKGWTETPGIVSPSEFRGFWVYYRYDFSFSSGASILIQVGKDGESTPFMTGYELNPLAKSLGLKFLGLSSWINDEATYIFPRAT